MKPDNRRLDLEWLEDFIALAETGNFSRAAEIRAIAQPAFSRHIRALEEWLGADLFDRSAHPATLTPAGRRFLPLLESVLADLDAARTKARAADAQAAAELRFAATHVLSLAFFPSWFGELEQRLGPRTVQIHSDSLQGCEALMLDRQVQFLLCHAHADVPGRLDEAGYPWVDVGHDALMPVSAPSVEGAPQFALGREQPLPVLDYHEASGLGRIVRTQLAASGADRRDFDVVFLAHHAAVLKTMALEGRGIAWLPRSIARDELEQRRLVPAGGREWELPLAIRLYRQRSATTDAAERLWDLVTKAAAAA